MGLAVTTKESIGSDLLLRVPSIHGDTLLPVRSWVDSITFNPKNLVPP